MAKRAMTIPAKSALRESYKRALRVIDNGHIVEKLRHCRFPKSRHQFVKAPS